MARKAKVEPVKDPLPDVLTAIADLQKGHDQGLAILKQYGDRAERGEIDQSAEEYGRTADAIRKLRQFATEYNKNDLRDLCNLCREHQRAFGLSLVFRLVAIKDKTERAAFQKEAIVNHWANGRIFKELQRRQITLGHHTCGRKRSLPQTVTEALVEIHEAKRLFVELLEHCTTIAKQGSGKASERLGEQCEKLLSAIKAVETREGRSRRSARSVATKGIDEGPGRRRGILG